MDLELEPHRPRLERLAYRFLGSLADAEDAVQDTYLRWHAAGRPELERPGAWLTTTCTRLCLDRLRSAERARREYPGEWLPEPWVEPAPPRAELDETLSLALLHTLERLRPTERAAFLLHDVFGHPFPEVASILELEPAHCRQLAVRARRHLQLERRGPAPAAEEVERLGAAFFRAVEDGDLAALERVLAEDVRLHADGGGQVSSVRKPLLGRAAVSRFFVRVLANERRLHPDVPLTREATWINGGPGVLVRAAGAVDSAIQFEVRAGRIQAIHVQRNPHKLRRVGEARGPGPRTDAGRT